MNSIAPGAIIDDVLYVRQEQDVECYGHLIVGKCMVIATEPDVATGAWLLVLFPDGLLGWVMHSNRYRALW